MTEKVKSPKDLRKEARERFANAQRLEIEYLRSLRHLTKQIDHIVKGMAPGGNVRNSAELQNVLRKYSETIRPWAEAVAEKMITKIARKDSQSWLRLGKSIGTSLRAELEKAPIGDMFAQFMREQVTLITSLPLEAAERVHKLATEGLLTGGRRASDIAKDILATGKVTESRAKLIARTEIARTASGLTMQRAKFVGSTHYVWRTSGDSDVRKSHKEMDGSIISWDTPPTLSDGEKTHAGMIFNCRCYPEPIIAKD